MKKLSVRKLKELIKAAEKFNGGTEETIRGTQTYRVIVGISVADELIVIVNRVLGIRLGCITQPRRIADEKLIVKWVNHLIEETEKQKGN